MPPNVERRSSLSQSKSAADTHTYSLKSMHVAVFDYSAERLTRRIRALCPSNQGRRNGHVEF